MKSQSPLLGGIIRKYHVSSAELAQRVVITIATDDSLFCFAFFFREIKLDISCKSPVEQKIHVKYQALLTLKTKKKTNAVWYGTLRVHYENTPMQIYRKFHLQKIENFQIKNSDIFSYFCSKHRLWVLVRTASARRF